MKRILVDLDPKHSTFHYFWEVFLTRNFVASLDGVILVCIQKKIPQWNLLEYSMAEPVDMVPGGIACISSVFQTVHQSWYNCMDQQANNLHTTHVTAQNMSSSMKECYAFYTNGSHHGEYVHLVVSYYLDYKRRF
jgi:hypothetical protein